MRQWVLELPGQTGLPPGDAALGARGLTSLFLIRPERVSATKGNTPAGAGVRFDPLKDLDPGKTAEVGITKGIDTLRNCVIK